MINSMIKSDYFDKQVDYSATDFTKPNYQLWMKKHSDKVESEQGFASWVGQLIHQASYDNPEMEVIKEFSGIRLLDFKHMIGGSIDRLLFDGNSWIIEDLKSQGMYPAKQAFKEPKQDWIIQLSVYRWILRNYGFIVNDTANIHQYVLGFTKNKDGMEWYNKLTIELLDIKETEELMLHKINEAEQAEAPLCDCEAWRCGYCEYSSVCPLSKVKNLNK